MRPSYLVSGVATGLRRNLSMTVALLLVTMVSLTFVGSALLARSWIGEFRRNYDNRLNVSVYLANDVAAGQTDAVRAALQSDPMVRSIEYVDQDQAFERGKKVLDPATAEFLEPGVLPASFTVQLVNQLRDYDAFADKYRVMDGVQQVQNQDKALKTLLELFSRVQRAALVVAAVVAAAALILMFNTVRIAAGQRRTETGIMRLVGATRWMVQLPFVIEAMIAAAVGGVLAMGALALGRVALVDSVLGQQVGSGVLPTVDGNSIIIVGGTVALCGVAVSALTAWITLRVAVRL
ncbi:MAG: permease-like cell division protein FtsX [Frankiaceae bacterium]|nr:permease-like cell division protein FtsX [Frankiaceae bacterium]